MRSLLLNGRDSLKTVTGQLCSRDQDLSLVVDAHRRFSATSSDAGPSFQQETESTGSKIGSFVKTLSRRLSARIKGPPELEQDNEDVS